MDEGHEATRRAIYENVGEGTIEIAGERDGEHVFRLTDEGTARVNAWIDAALRQHGERAAEAFAEAFEIPLWMAEDIIAHRVANSHETSEASS